MLGWQEQLDALVTVSEAAAAAATDLEAPIAHCPGWNVRALVSHLADVQWFWAESAERRITDGNLVRRPSGTPAGVDPVVYLRAQSERLVTALSMLEETTPLWTWFESQQHAGFVLRRQLIEATVHVWDLENAGGAPAEVPAPVAVVGLDEFVDVMAHNLIDDTVAPSAEVAIDPTDADWSGTMFEGAGPTVRLQAPSAELLLALWGRAPVDDERIVTALANINMA